MNYFVYNGVSSLDMGLRIESKNVFSAPEYDVTFQSIPGRNGDLILPNGRYPNVQVTYSVFLPAKSIAELAEKITKVKEAWLYGEQNAYHTLSDSTKPYTPGRRCIPGAWILRTNSTASAYLPSASPAIPSATAWTEPSLSPSRSPAPQ